MTFGATEIVLGISILLQIGSAVTALRLIRITGWTLAWGLVAGAIGLMAVRRMVTFWSHLTGEIVGLSDLVPELIALVISVMMWAGLLTIAPLFRALRDSRDAVREAVGLASARAEELAEANAELGREVAERKDAEALAAAHAEVLGRSLAQLAEGRPLDEFMRTLLPLVVDRLGGLGGAIWLRDEGDGKVRLYLEYERGQIHTRDRSQHPRVRAGGMRRVPWQPDDDDQVTVTTIWHAGMPDDWVPEKEAQYLAARGVKRIILTPMLAGGRPLGWFTIRFPEAASKESEQEVRLAEALVRQATLAVLLERFGHRAEETAVLRERNRLAREIHDTLAQGFTGTLMQLEAAQAIAPDLPERAMVHLERIRELARSGLEEARRSVWALRPLALEGRGLIESLRHVAKAVSSDLGSDATVDVDARGKLDAIPVDLQAELLRIAQECVTNAVKHGRPKRVEVALAVADGGVRLEISDDGIGLREASLSSDGGGFGLIGMKDRALRMGGTLDVVDLQDEDPDGRAGTRVSCRIPLPRANPPRGGEHPGRSG